MGADKKCVSPKSVPICLHSLQLGMLRVAGGSRILEAGSGHWKCGQPAGGAAACSVWIRRPPVSGCVSSRKASAIGPQVILQFIGFVDFQLSGPCRFLGAPESHTNTLSCSEPVCIGQFEELHS